MSGNWTRKSEPSCNFEPFAPCQTSTGVDSKCERARSALCYGLYCTTNSAATHRVAEEKSSLKNQPFDENENLCSVLHTGTRLPRTMYFIFSICLVMGTNAINTDRPYTPSSSIAPAATAGYRCRWHRSSGSYSRQSGETAIREERSKRKRE